MADEKFLEDKELGKGGRAEQQTLEPSNTSDLPKHSAGQITFLICLLWTCWTIACISDTLLSIEWAIVTYTRMTPLQHWIYYKRWDLWLYNVRLLPPNPLHLGIATGLTVLARPMAHIGRPGARKDLCW